MQIFLSSLEAPGISKAERTDKISTLPEYMLAHGVRFKYNLMSFFRLRTGSEFAKGCFIRNHSEEILIDSGAFTLRKTHEQDLDAYTKEYADFIKRFDRPNVLGYVEMDVDNVAGYEKTLEYRRILKKASPKIIPVWHHDLGGDEFVKMCKENKIIALDVHGRTVEELKRFVATAHKYGAKVHGLAATSKDFLEQVPFDYVDSRSWSWGFYLGKVPNSKKRLTREYTKNNNGRILTVWYKYWQSIQKKYDRWKDNTY